MSFFKKIFSKNRDEKIEEVNKDLQGHEVVEQEEANDEKPHHEEESDKVTVNEEKIVEEIHEGQENTPITYVPEEEEIKVEDVAQLENNENGNIESVVNEQNVEKVEQESNEEETAYEEKSEADESKVKKGFIKRLFSGLSKTRDSILKGVDDVLSNFKHIDEDLYEELEEALIMADFGVDTTLRIMEMLKEKVKQEKITEPSLLKNALQEIITGILTDQPVSDILSSDSPTVILVIGVNGVGKTTSIGKMSHLFRSRGKKVLVAAADTFRAAAIEQLQVWTDRAGVDLIKHEEGTDAAAVVFDAIAAAKSRRSDVLICDTAGRLQNKTNLMKELEKISRIIKRDYPEAKQEILIVLDATTGQNAIQQVKLFKEVADINGIILTKLDGTAKGGAIVGIYESMKVPVKYIGVGEKMDDLQPFDAEAFATALFKEE